MDNFLQIPDYIEPELALDLAENYFDVEEDKKYVYLKHENQIHLNPLYFDQDEIDSILDGIWDFIMDDVYNNGE